MAHQPITLKMTFERPSNSDQPGLSNVDQIAKFDEWIIENYNHAMKLFTQMIGASSTCRACCPFFLSRVAPLHEATSVQRPVAEKSPWWHRRALIDQVFHTFCGAVHWMVGVGLGLEKGQKVSWSMHAWPRLCVRGKFPRFSEGMLRNEK